MINLNNIISTLESIKNTKSLSKSEKEHVNEGIKILKWVSES